MFKQYRCGHYYIKRKQWTRFKRTTKAFFNTLIIIQKNYEHVISAQKLNDFIGKLSKNQVKNLYKAYLRKNAGASRVIRKISEKFGCAFSETIRKLSNVYCLN